VKAARRVRRKAARKRPVSTGTGPRRAAHPVHEQMATANIYLHADMEEKERAIAPVTPPDTAPGRYQPPDPLLAFLDSL
jgi:hypothetical protein